MKLTDGNGIPTVEGARMMFAAMDEARTSREWREAEQRRRKRDEHIAMRAAHLGIPLACAGEIGFTMGGTRWIGACGSWFYEGIPAWMCEGCNVTLIATPETDMDAETFGRLWRGVVRDLMRVAKCVRVRVIEPAD